CRGHLGGPAGRSRRSSRCSVERGTTPLVERLVGRHHALVPEHSAPSTIRRTSSSFANWLDRISSPRPPQPAKTSPPLPPPSPTATHGTLSRGATPSPSLSPPLLQQPATPPTRHPPARPTRTSSTQPPTRPLRPAMPAPQSPRGARPEGWASLPPTSRTSRDQTGPAQTMKWAITRLHPAPTTTNILPQTQEPHLHGNNAKPNGNKLYN
ncbi:hypothetical protein T492DRAFT_1122034, partial [Pavlovales sp. CCMP2436]